MLTARRRAPLSLAPIVLLLLHLPVPTRAKSDGQGVACDDATASLCSYECPEHAKQSSVPWATLNANGRFEPCCPYGMDRVAPPTRNAAYRIHLDGIRGTTKNSLAAAPSLLLFYSYRYKGQPNHRVLI